MAAPAISRRMPVWLDPAFGDCVADAAPEDALLAAEPEPEPERVELAEVLPEAVALADPLMLELDPEDEDPPPSPARE